MLGTVDTSFQGYLLMTHALKSIPDAPEFRNSAGRLLRLLEMLPSRESYYDVIVKLYGFDRSHAADAATKGELFLEFMQIVSSAYQGFVADAKSAPDIPEKTRAEILGGLSTLAEIIYPANPNGTARGLSESELALVRIAASMIPEEDELEDDEKSTIAESIDQLRATIENTELPKSVRVALLEVARLSRNSLDQYNIYGARGFKSAFKRMLSELMEVYLNQSAETLRDKSWWQQAVYHVKRFDALAARLLKYQPLLEHAGTLLLGKDD